MNDSRRKTSIVLVTALVITAVLVGSYAYQDGGEDLDGRVFIVHTNDSHGYYDENLGFARVAALADDLESRGATVFLMDAGDAFQGTAATMLTHGSSTADVMNAVGYDVMTLGNHEFDYGLETCLGNAESLAFPTVCANLVWEDTGESVFPEYTVLEEDGVRVGVFGLLTPEAEWSTMAGNLDGVTITDPVRSSERMVDALEGEGVDYVVALGHIGVHRSSDVRSDDICSEVDGIDLFVDGHSHTVMSGGRVADGSIDLAPSDTVIASTGSLIEHIGLVELSGDAVSATLVDSFGHTDPDVDAAVEGIHEGIDQLLSERVGSTEIHLEGDRIQSRLHEVGMGDLVTDVIRDRTGSDIAVFNGGAFRASIGIGDVTKGDVYNAVPFENYVVVKTMTGAQVLRMLEEGLSGLPEAKGGYLQVSGMTVTYDSSGDAGSRVVSVTVGGTPLDPGHGYSVASNDYIMSGSDGTGFIADIPSDGEFGLVSDAVFSYFERVGTVSLLETGRLVDVAP